MLPRVFFTAAHLVREVSGIAALAARGYGVVITFFPFALTLARAIILFSSATHQCDSRYY